MKIQNLKILAILLLIISFSFFQSAYASDDDNVDTVQIDKGVTINIYESKYMSDWGDPVYIIVEGVLRFPVSGVYLDLPAGSGIMVMEGGLITANDVNRSDANGILIGGDLVWQRGQGHLNPVPKYNEQLTQEELLINNQSLDGDDQVVDRKIKANTYEISKKPIVPPTSDLTVIKLYTLKELKGAFK